MPPLKPIIAQFIESDRCSAEGLEVMANAPGLVMCRKLLEAGYDPDRPLHCFRGEVLAMEIRLGRVLIKLRTVTVT